MYFNIYNLNVLVVATPLYFILAAYFYLFIKKKPKYSFLQFTGRYMLITYLITLASLTLMIDGFYGTNMQSLGADFNIQLIPFKTILQMIRHNNWFIQILGNILIIMPFTCLVGLIKKKSFTFKSGFLYSIGISLFIELGQLSLNIITNFPHRSPDIDDVILNTLGGLLGWGLQHYIKKHKKL